MVEDEIIIGSLQSLTMAQQPDISMADLEGWKNCDFTDDYVWIFVEGVDDRQLYSPLFGENVLVWESVNDKNQCGCANLEAIVNYASSLSLSNVIGIRDKDYTPYLESYVQPSNVFMTDEHDIELMMLESEEVKRGIEQRKPLFRIYLHRAYSALRGIGYLRAYSISMSSGFNFDAAITCRNIWRQDVKQFVSGWRKRIHDEFFSTETVDFSRKDYICFIRHHGLHHESSSRICQGHDVVNLLEWMGAINNPYDKFRTYFDNIAFSHTNLYSALLSWSQSNNFTIF